MAALDAEHYLQEIGSQQGKSDWGNCWKAQVIELLLIDPWFS